MWGAGPLRPARGVRGAEKDKGGDVLRRIWPFYAAGIAEHFGRHISDEEARTLTEVRSRVLDADRED